MTAVEIAGVLDAPAPEQVVHRHGFAAIGWVWSATRDVWMVEVTSAGLPLGSTTWFFPRADAAAALGVDTATPVGYEIDCVVPDELRGGEGIYITLTCVETSGERTVFAERYVVFSSFDYRVSAHGYQLSAGFTQPVPRDAVYATGPPAPVASDVVVDLVLRYLDPGARVLDVGCGIGAFGRAFRDRGRSWTGCEVRPDFVARAREDGLDAHVIEGARLPFADGNFDAAIAIEVLEHVRDPEPFLREMHRVAPRLAIVSVPNFEAVPIAAAFYGLPWHMLEPDHWLFYARGSLKAVLERHYRSVEVLAYGELPLLRAVDGLPIHNHLLGVARG